MRKFCKVLLITAGIIVGIGIVLCALGFAFGGGDFMRTMSRDYKSMSATFDEVEIIEVIESSNKVKIEKSSTDEVKVTYSVCEDYSYKLSCDYLQYCKDNILVVFPAYGCVFIFL